MLGRLIMGASLFALGYYLGKQVGMTTPIRDELERTRDTRTTDAEGHPAKASGDESTPS